MACVRRKISRIVLAGVATLTVLSGVVVAGVTASPAGALSAPRISDVSLPARVDPGETLVMSWRVESEVGIGQYFEPGGLRPSTWVKLGGPSGWISWCGFPLVTRQVSGTPTDGRYEISCRVPDVVPNGSYSLFLSAVDTDGAYADEQQFDFLVLGGSSDGAAPFVGDVSVDSVSESCRTVVLSWRATDETGVAGVVPWAFGPNGRVTDDAGAMWLGYAAGSLVSGDERDGRYSVSLPLSVSAVPGTYTIWFSVADVVGNREARVSPAGPGSVFASFALDGGDGGGVDCGSRSGGSTTSTTLPGVVDGQDPVAGVGVGDVAEGGTSTTLSGSGGADGADGAMERSGAGEGDESLFTQLVSSSRVQGASGVIGLLVLGLALAAIARGAFARRARRDA